MYSIVKREPAAGPLLYFTPVLLNQGTERKKPPSAPRSSLGSSVASSDMHLKIREHHSAQTWRDALEDLAFHCLG